MLPTMSDDAIASLLLPAPAAALPDWHLGEHVGHSGAAEGRGVGRHRRDGAQGCDRRRHRRGGRARGAGA